MRFHNPGPWGGTDSNLFRECWNAGGHRAFQDRADGITFSTERVESRLNDLRQISFEAYAAGLRCYSAVMSAAKVRPAPDGYNCFAYALGSDVWEEPYELDYTDARLQAAGFVPCEVPRLGVEAMVAAFGFSEQVEHIAVLRKGQWDSKMGAGPVLVHDSLSELEPFGPVVGLWRTLSGEWSLERQCRFLEEELRARGFPM